MFTFPLLSFFTCCFDPCLVVQINSRGVNVVQRIYALHLEKLSGMFLHDKPTAALALVKLASINGSANRSSTLCMFNMKLSEATVVGSTWVWPWISVHITGMSCSPASLLASHSKKLRERNNQGLLLVFLRTCEQGYWTLKTGQSNSRKISVRLRQNNLPYALEVFSASPLG